MNFFQILQAIGLILKIVEHYKTLEGRITITEDDKQKISEHIKDLGFLDGSNTNSQY